MFRRYLTTALIICAMPLCVGCAGMNPFQDTSQTEALAQTMQEVAVTMKETAATLRAPPAPASPPAVVHRPVTYLEPAATAAPPLTAAVPAVGPPAPETNQVEAFTNAADKLDKVADTMSQVASVVQSTASSNPGNPLGAIGQAAQQSAPLFGPATPYVYAAGAAMTLLGTIFGTWKTRGSVYTTKDIKDASADLGLKPAAS